MELQDRAHLVPRPRLSPISPGLECHVSSLGGDRGRVTEAGLSLQLVSAKQLTGNHCVRLRC